MTGPSPQFEQLFNSFLFPLQRSATDNGWVAFLFPKGGKPATETFGVTESFEKKGYYLFAPTAPYLSDEAAVDEWAENVWRWLEKEYGSIISNVQATLWLTSVNGPDFGEPGATSFTFLNKYTSSNINVPLGHQLSFAVTNKTFINCSDNGFVFSSQVSPLPQFVPYTGYVSPTVGTGSCAIPFFGPHTGCFTMSGKLSDDCLDDYETGIAYSYLGNRDFTKPQVYRQVYPTIMAGFLSSDIGYNGVLDPLDQFNEGACVDMENGIYRTFFAMDPGTEVPSWVRSVTGHTVTLQPQGRADENGEPVSFSGGVAPERVSPAATVATTPMYFSLVGDFAITIKGEAEGTTVSLLPGLFGSERLNLRTASGEAASDRLRFQPGSPAYAPMFPFPESNLNDPGKSVPKERLDDTRRTAWMALVNGDGGEPAYLAQPEGNPLYGLDPSATGDETMLPPMPTPSALPQSLPVFFPFAPYAGLGGGESDSFPSGESGPFESQILAAVRKKKIGDATVSRIHEIKTLRRTRNALTTAAGRVGVTPQGLLASVEQTGQDSDYVEVFLAKSVLSGNTIVDFGFGDLSPELQQLFQTNQLFSVIANPAHLGNQGSSIDPASPTFANEVSMSDWRMKAAVGSVQNQTAFTNVMVMKFCEGTLLDRVKNPSKWSGVEDFSVSPSTSGSAADIGVALAGLSTWLSEYIQTGIDRSDGGKNKFYTHFARIAQDTNWNGVLVLRASVDPSGFPDEIKGLVAGIDFTMFEAHHFGVTASRVTLENGVLSMKEPSSLFGLIDYELPAYQQNVASNAPADMPLPLLTEPGSDFAFTVLQLQTLFENGFMTDFKSRVQLSVEALFGSRVTGTYQGTTRLPAQAVVLKGSYVKQGDIPTYIFEQDDVTLFGLNSSALPTVAFRRIQFNTLSTSADETVLSRFLVWGNFAFPMMNDNDEQEVDLLSFGPAKDASVSGNNVNPPGLAFSDLEISMISPLSSPNAVTFGIDTGRLALDQGSSQPRAHSLFTDLALQVDGFVSGSEEKRPIDYGYLPISVSPKLKAISGAWYGIEYKVNMGTPGALASGAGFTSRILVAWSPETVADDSASAVFIGLQLPGAKPGAKLLSIQGVLKLSIASLTLTREAVGDSDRAFVLRLNNLGLSFLGLLKLPPGANINFFLFGDPSGAGSLGWYAAYQATDKEKATLSSEKPIPALSGEQNRELIK